MESIYRFISFESFFDTIKRQALTFVPLEFYEDPYEGFIFKALKDQQGKSKIIDYLSINFPDHINQTYLTLALFEKTIHCQSWTKCPESDALWRIYSHSNYSVRIEVKIKELRELGNVNIHDIIYTDASLEDILDSLIEENGVFALRNAYLYKRKAFEHEQEVRLLSTIDKNYLPNHRTEKQKAMLINGLSALTSEGIINEEDKERCIQDDILKKQNIPIVKHISFSHIEKFIESVMLHPLASDWFDETIKAFCNEKEIKYLGKSRLYHLEF